MWPFKGSIKTVFSALKGATDYKAHKRVRDKSVRQSDLFDCLHSYAV